MAELSLESLARRIEELERRLANAEGPRKDWRRVAGMFKDSDFMKQVDEEIAVGREAERQAAREGRCE